MKVSIIGTGAWGGALAQVLADNNYDVVMWSYSEQEAWDINERHVITALDKKGISHKLPETIVATTKLSVALQETSYIVFAVPSFVLRTVAQQVNLQLQQPVVCIDVTKGIEKGTHCTMSEVIESEIAIEKRSAVVALTGPTHAEEVIARKITTIVSACADTKTAKQVQMLFNNNTYFRVYVNKDRKGAETGGALKNIFAIIAGMAMEFQLGDNAKAALITRGLYEMVKIGCYLGAEERTFSGLTGLGDLIVTTTSEHSRNFQAGKLLAQGVYVAEIESTIGATVEGLHAVYSAYEIVQAGELYTPLIALLYQVITEQVAPKVALQSIFEREVKNEFFDEVK